MLVCPSGRTLQFLGCRINALITQNCARVTISTNFRNDTKDKCTAVFQFDKPADWELNFLKLEIAETSYESNVGYEAGSEAPSTKLSVPLPGPISVNLQVIVTCVFVVELRVHNQNHQLLIPKIILPKAAIKEKDVDWDNHFQVPFTPKLPHNISLEVHCAMDTDVISITSSAPNLVPNTHGATASAYCEMNFLPTEPLFLEKDIEINVLVKPYKSFMQVNIVKEVGSVTPEDAIAISMPLVPQIDTPNVNTELIFLIDCSGSMMQHIAKVERAIKLCLQALPPSVLFNICLYGDSFRFLEESKCVAFTNENLVWARAFVHNLAADLGGTNLHTPVSLIYKLPLTRGYCRQIFLVTDGSVNKPYELLQLAKHNAHTTRIFPFCYPSRTADKDLYEKLASASNGNATFFGPASDPTKVMLGTLQEALQPCLTQTTLNYSYEGGNTADVTSALPPIRTVTKKLPLLFHQERYVVFALGASNLSPNPVCTLTAWVGDKHVQWTYHMGDLSSAQKSENMSGSPTTASVLHTYVAMQRIRELTEFNPSSSLSLEEADEVRRLSKTFHVLSPITRVTCHSPTSNNPLAVSVGYHYKLPRRETNQPKVLGPATLPVGEPIALRPLPDPDFESTDKKMKADSRNVYLQMLTIVEEIVHGVTRTPGIDDILFIQAAAGNWVMSQRFAASIDVSLEKVEAALPNMPGAEDVVVPAIKERDRRAEEERRRLEEEAAEQRRREEELAVRKAQKEIEQQRKKERARAKMTQEEMAAMAAEEQRRIDEQAERAKKEAEQLERDRKEQEKAAERDRKKRELERKKLIKKKGEDAVKAEEEAEKKRQQEEQDRQRREEEAAMRREEDMRQAWEENEREKYLLNVWATAIALAYLELVYTAQVHEFTLLAQRGAAWLSATGLPGAPEWVARARAFLTPILADRKRTRELEIEQQAKAKEEAQRGRERQEALRAEQQHAAEVERRTEKLRVLRENEERRVLADNYSSDEETEDTRRLAVQQLAEEERLLAERLAAEQVIDEVVETEVEHEHDPDAPVDEEEEAEEEINHEAEAEAEAEGEAEGEGDEIAEEEIEEDEEEEEE
eukprot:TRINITY_DN18305_c0_g3_i1.p1 TRINITY_DN18305_c0_g3~~TRINITY_DN18305_c0_g3_i1.p1  ORF type:complete len:1084 (-),score=248.64 TRINITY_DN18305_c0_g3_i1:116-3367(-)